MPDAVIVAGARSAIGTARKGTLVDVDPFDLARYGVQEIVQRSGIPTDQIDDVVFGEVLQGGGDIARYAALESGIANVPGIAHNRHCASGLSALQTAAGSIMAGMDQVVIAGGAESISMSPGVMRRVPGTDEYQQWMSPSHPEEPDAPAFDMSITVGWNTAQRGGITREELDEFAYRTHMDAIRAIDDGRFQDEIFPIEVKRRDGSTTVFDTDEHPRRETSLEKLASLKPLHPEIDGFSITAGNASGMNDAVAAVMMVSSDYAEAHGLTPLARIRSWASVGVEPRHTGYGPVYAIPKALERAGLSVGDIDLWEVNEAFCSVPIAVMKELGVSRDRLNVNGSGCSLGHPVAATGARMVITTMFELRRRGGGLGAVSMCAGGGMGSATVFEVFPA